MTAFAQSDRLTDFGGIVSGEAEVGLGGPFGFSMEEELRFDHNFSQFDRWLNSVGVDYTCLHDRMNIGLVADYIRRHNDLGYYENRGRLGLQVNYAEEFAGNYTVSTIAHLQIPVLGSQDIPLSDMDASIVLDGDKGDVKLTLAGQTTNGYVNDKGLHVDPIMINETIMNIPMTINVTFPVISKPVNGVSSWTATLAANSSYGNITGTADMTAVKQ